MLEAMSQFASKADMWEARCIRFAKALSKVMDGIPDGEIQSKTGVSKEDCEMILQAREDVKLLLRQN